MKLQRSLFRELDCLISIFNGISTFVSYLKPRPPLLKNKGAHFYPESIPPKVNVIAQREFEHTTMSQPSTFAITPRVLCPNSGAYALKVLTGLSCRISNQKTFIERKVKAKLITLQLSDSSRKFSRVAKALMIKQGQGLKPNITRLSFMNEGKPGEKLTESIRQASHRTE